MAAFRSASFFTTSTTGTTTTGTEPAGTVQNDVMVAALAVENAATITLPTGWSVLYTASSGTAFSYWLGYILRGASAPSFAWTHANEAYRELHILSFSAVDTTTPVDASADGGASAGTAPPDPPAATPTGGLTDDMAIAVGMHWSGSPAGGWVAPTGYTLRSDNTVGNDVAVATKQLTLSSAEDPAAFTVGTTLVTNQLWSATVLLRNSGGAPASAPIMSVYGPAYAVQRAATI